MKRRKLCDCDTKGSFVNQFVVANQLLQKARVLSFVFVVSLVLLLSPSRRAPVHPTNKHHPTQQQQPQTSLAAHTRTQPSPLKKKEITTNNKESKQ